MQGLKMLYACRSEVHVVVARVGLVGACCKSCRTRGEEGKGKRGQGGGSGPWGGRGRQK